MSQPKPYTPEEVRQILYNHLRDLCKYWANPKYGKSEQERMESLCFSILSMIDGATMLPAIDMRLAPHPSDKAFLIKKGERWFKPKMLINDCHMHEEFYAKQNENSRTTSA